MLRAHREREEAVCADQGTTFTVDRLVFCYAAGDPILPHRLPRAFEVIADKIGLNNIRLHDLRHTHASLIAADGIHLKVVQERLGHASIATTMDLYSHVMPGLHREAAERFGERMKER